MTRPSPLRRSVAALAATLIAACSDSERAPSAPAARTSFERIQRDVFDRSCATSGCHVSGSVFALQSGLVLDGASSYASLVGVRPKNAAALADGMWRVRPRRSDSSLLLHKLHVEATHHHADYGSVMPLGGVPLTVGQVEYIRRWIDAGAARAGDDLDTTLLADRTAQVDQGFVPLAPPAVGYQLKIEQFTVAPNFERELFSYRKVGNATDVYVNRIETKMRTNSHHFIAYDLAPGTPASAVPPPDVLRDIRNADGSLNLLNMRTMPYQVFFAGAMTQVSDYRLPDGVALFVPAGASLDLNSHYVNRTGSAIPGEAYINLHTVPASQVQRVARTLNLNNLSISLPPHARTTLTRTFVMSQPTTVIMLTSHMHARGERFVIRIKGGARDGEVVYDNTDWAHPAIVTYTEPIVLRAGEGLTSVVTYNNATDRTITFGLTSEDEMDIIFGYAY